MTFNYAVTLGTGRIINCKQQADKYGITLEEYCDTFPISCSIKVESEVEAETISDKIKADNARIAEGNF